MLKPTSLNIRTYQVGFGDCFLLSFAYTDCERHVLIDFGSTARPHDTPDDWMLRIAKNIRKRSGGKLTAVVATHRHQDHISGFASAKNGRGSGAIIRSLKPDLVLQPWTEDPELAPDSIGPNPVSSPDPRRRRTAALGYMQAIAEQVSRAARAMPDYSAVPKPLKDELQFLGDDNIANRRAVTNLMRMGAERRYLHAGSESGLDQYLPGVETFVLGPPTLEQTEEVRKQRSRDDSEFWHLRMLAAGGKGDVKKADAEELFAREYVREGRYPEDARWLINKAQRMRADQMLSIVRSLDKALNNTSLVLLMKIGRRSILFPGDAQYENWAYALAQPKYRRLLRDVDLYKVGHHGSLNATPKSLWSLFRKRSTEDGPHRLRTVLSTMPGKHGKAGDRTEVPRTTLKEALHQETKLVSTDELPPMELYRDVELQLE
jgi:hypothetical protein